MGRLQQAAVYVVIAAVALSGLFWLVLHDLIESEPNELSHWLLVVHGSSTYALLLVLGSLLPVHVRSGWRRSRNIGTGVSVAVIMTILLVTALLLYYGSEETRLPARWGHIGVGLLVFAVFPVHVLIGRTLKRSLPSSNRDAALREHNRSSERAASFAVVAPRWLVEPETPRGVPRAGRSQRPARAERDRD